ncbi:DUF4386 domain-containing protein [Nonomuraea sp. NPDC049152]|uniref:DUF4386 domain-containing protein n=1 Tax=Nonomuraea sp. NPDC049152 TaxID=3154350 RepID=UPI0033F6EF76
MHSNPRAAARFIGVLFLTALIANGIGSELAESTTDRTVILVGELLELLCGAAVVGVGALTYVVFRDWSPGLATGYLGFRITEAAVNAIIVVSTLTAAGLPQEYRDVLLAQRYQAQLVYIFVFVFGAAVWYVLLHRMRAVPRFLTVWGLGGVAILLVGALFDLFGLHIDMLLYGLPLGVNELVLGVWLITRGFTPPARATPEPV